jgi:signal transduction histidine kinase
MSSDDNSVRIHDYSRTSDHVAESIKNADRDIRDSSSTTKRLIHTLVRSGAFEEIVLAILDNYCRTGGCFLF